MVRIGIQAVHEQLNPAELLEDVITMENYGLKRCWSSDHYMPWWHTGASGGAAWPWLGAALAKTKHLVIGTAVTAPILRYNPAIIAQVFATLDFMFPGRTFLTLGTGESLNEVPATGSPWPSNKERFERLKEAIQLIKTLGRKTGLRLKENTSKYEIQTSTQNQGIRSIYQSMWQLLANKQHNWLVKNQMDLLQTN